MTFTEPLLGVRVGGVPGEGRGAPLTIFNPGDGSELAQLHEGDADDVAEAVQAARGAAFGAWAGLPAADRGRICRRIADLLRADERRLTEIGMLDGGLPAAVARADVANAARYFEFFGSVAEAITGDTLPLGDGSVAMTLREPWGVCAIILPFNFPLQLAARDLAPALAMGNTVVLKPAELTPFGPLALVDICTVAGVPAGVVNAVVGSGTSGAALIEHPDVDHITFTGSVATGRTVMATAADRIVPTIVELGGKSPHVVFGDASLDEVVPTVISASMRSAGQACSAGTRVLVESARYREVVEGLGEALSALVVGAPESDPDVGPVASARQQAAIEAAIELSARHGLVRRTPLSSEIDASGGYYVAPTMVSDPGEGAEIVAQEVFGPVITVQPFHGEAHAVSLANDTPFGLVAGIWTRDGARAMRVARGIRAGQVFINNYGVGGGVELPFGGYKRSGVGRAKGLAGALEYTQIKTVAMVTR